MYGHVSLVPRPLFFFLFVWGQRKIGSGGSPIHFLCSWIYNFWGSFISGDESQRPVNEATIGNKVHTQGCSLAKQTCAVFPIVTSLTGLCYSPPLIDDPQKL